MAHQVCNLTNAEYRAQRGYSKSDLDYIHQSPALLEWARNAPSVGSEEVDLGTHVHCATLEPDVFAGTYRKAPAGGRTAADRSRVEAFAEHCKTSGKICLDADTYDMVIAMRDSVLAHPTARDLLTGDGISESSIFGELEGVRVKCRPDRLIRERNILVDVKKTASIHDFRKSAINFRYRVQHAFYSDIYEQWTGVRPRFIFVVVGQKREIGRHPVRVWELDEVDVEAGRREYLDDLAIAKEVEQFGCGLHIERLSLENRFT